MIPSLFPECFAQIFWPNILTLKTQTLSAVLCGQRAKDILTVVDICRIEFVRMNYVIIKTGYLLKASNIHFHKVELKFQAYEKEKKAFVLLNST